MLERKSIDQPKTEVWLEDGMLYIEQKSCVLYSDDSEIIVLNPLFVPLFVSWLFELISPEAVG